MGNFAYAGEANLVFLIFAAGASSGKNPATRVLNLMAHAGEPRNALHSKSMASGIASDPLSPADPVRKVLRNPVIAPGIIPRVFPNPR